MDTSRKIVLLRNALGPIRADKTHKGELLFTCPRRSCGKNKLCVNIESDKFHCWVCGFGDVVSLDRLLKPSDRDEYRAASSFHRREEKKFVKPELPRELFSLSSSRDSTHVRLAREYLARRGVSDEKIALYKLMFSEEGRYAFRIVVPSFDADGSLNFFVGRSLVETDQRYMHGVFDKNIVFNDLLVDWDKPIVLTEGPFDAIAAGTNAIPLQGKFLSESSMLLKKIVDTGVDVHLALDADADAKRVALTAVLMGYGVDCYDVPLLGKNDMGEMTDEEAKTALSRSKKIDSVLRTRIDRAARCA